MVCHQDSTSKSRYLNLASPEYTNALEAPLQQEPTPAQDANPSAAPGTEGRDGNPYFTLPHPVVYKLRTCCLDDFIPITTDMDPDDFFDDENVDGSTYYTTRKLELPDTGVAYLFRGRKYLLVEPIDRPAGKYTTIEPIMARENEREVGLYELMPIDPRDFLEFPENTATSFIFSFNCQPKPSSTQEQEAANHLHSLIKEKSNSSIGLNRTESISSDICLPDVDPSSYPHSRIPSANQYPATLIPITSQVAIPALPPLDRRISATSNSSSELSSNYYSDSNDDNPGVYAAVTPCECQLIRQLQLIHRMITNYVVKINECLLIHAPILPPFVRAAIARCEVGSYFTHTLASLPSSRVMDPMPFPTAIITRLLSVSEVSIEAGDEDEMEELQIGSMLDKIQGEGHAQTMTNELKEMWQILEYYSY